MITDLGRGEYLLLTTFRKDGTPVPTPVWVAPGPTDDVIYAWSAKETGKVKRIRRSGDVEIGPLGTTTDPCASDALTAQDVAITADLATVTRWRVEGPGLVLTDDEGRPRLTLLGIVGAILAVPTAAILLVVITEVLESRDRANQ